jgi:SAM-dependent methyltransferase
VKSLLDGIMERRARTLIAQIGEWLPDTGPVLDLGSGTGHLAARIERETGIEVITADVSDMHVTGRRPVVIADGALPFDDAEFSAALLIFMLAYPKDPAALLAEAARVADGPIILVQSLYSGALGYAWLRWREFFWTIIAFHVSKLLGYVPREARFTMNTRRYYTDAALRRDLTTAGLRIRDRRERPVLPGRALIATALMLERDA